MKNIARIFFFLITLFPILPCFAEELSVTAVRSYQNEGESLFEVTFNNAIVVSDVSLVSVAGKKVLRFPEYVSRKQRAYPQVILMTRRINDAARNAVVNNTPAPFAGGVTEYKVTRFAPFRKRSDMKVLAAVAFDGELEIECKVIDGKNGPWISWPSKKSKKSGEWEKQVVISDKKLRESVEEALLTRYRAMASEDSL